MCSFLLKEHFGIKERDINFSCTELDGIIPGEEKSIRLVSDFDALAKKMKELSLPLRIRDVLPTSPALRYTAACVPEPIARNGLKGGQTYIAPITGVIRFEASTSWPTDDEDAIQKVKTALLVKLSEALQTTYMIDSFPYDDHIEVVFKGVVYSLCVHHPREITLYRTIDPARAEAMSRECVQAPLHHSALHSTAVRFHAFTKTVRLAKRWLSAHLFSDHIAEETVELLVASLFVGHAPERAPQTHTAGLYRFLALLASFAPADLPAFVLADLGSGGGSGSDLTQGNYKSAVGQMNHLKAKSPGEAGGLFVVSSYARARNVWAVPAPVVMRRIIAFARKCAEMLRGFILSPKHIPATEWRAIFNHSMDDYDIVVALDPYKLPTLPLALPWQASEAALAKLAAREAVAVKRARRLEQLAEGMAVPPLVGFDPSALLCDALRKSYGSKALFFRNALGGEAVGIVWRPGSLAPHKWSPKDMLSVMPADDDNDKKKMKKGELGSDIVQINVPEFVRDIEIIGSGLVKSVSTKKDTKQ